VRRGYGTNWFVSSAIEVLDAVWIEQLRVERGAERPPVGYRELLRLADNDLPAARKSSATT
jgi:hypothetical protein